MNSNTTDNYIEMSLTKLSKTELLAKCSELGITKCKSKNKSDLIEMIANKQIITNIPLHPSIDFGIQNNELVEQIDLIVQPIIREPHPDKYTLVYFFCGTGAFSYSFHQTDKVKTIFANDMLDSSEKYLI